MAQGVAWVARELGVPCAVVVPDHAPAAKLDPVVRLGARVVKVPFDAWWRTLVERGHPDMPGRFVHAVADRRVMAGKTMNAGQVCLAPDYVLAPRERLDEFVNAAKAATTKMFPAIKDNADYTAMINQRHYDRVRGLIADAKAKGADVVEINPANEDFSQQEHRKIPPTLILGATDDMTVMQEEIFGPVLPVRTYSALDETISEINARPRPLALYYFGVI